MRRWVQLAAVSGLFVLALRATGAAAAPVDDETRMDARTLGYSGVEAYSSGDYRTASDKLERSYQMLPVPTLGLWSARALVKLGRLVEAQERYLSVTRLTVRAGDQAVQQTAKVDAERERAELLHRIPRLRVLVEGAAAHDVLVTIDGVALRPEQIGQEKLLDPGRHTVVGTRDTQRSEVLLALLEGAEEQVVLRLSPAPPVAPAAPAAPPRVEAAPDGSAAAQHRLWRSLGWVSLGVGAAGLGTSVVTYFIGQNKREDLPAGCVNDECPPSASDAVDSYEAVRTIHSVSLAAGVVFVAAGVTVLLVTATSGQELALRVQPAGAELVGTF
jgi:hypothetical protein